jgi:hypothetical protein
LLSAAASAPSAGAPLYTNEDLERVHPYRGQTGVLSVPAVEPSLATPAARHGARSRLSDEAAQEAYWRREATRHRQRMGRLERAANALRRQIDQKRRQRSTGRGKGNAGSEALELRLAEKLAEIEEADSEFEERSRRAGALPGWLR